MKVIELPTLDRNSPILKCENCGKQSLICQLHRTSNSSRLFCHCGKDFIILPQNASDYSWSNHEPSPAGRSRNIEHESTCEPIGRDGLGDSISKYRLIELLFSKKYRHEKIETIRSLIIAEMKY